MMAQLYKNLYQNWCDDVDYKWDKLVEMANNPQLHETKDTIPLFSFYSYKEDAEMLWAGIKACGESMDSLLAIMVDYDDGIIQMCHLEHMFKFKFLAYSSPTSSPAKQKFRMVIPLPKGLPNKWLKCKKVREYLMSKFPHCDTTTFDYFRRQRVPSKLPSTDYSVLVSEGERIDLDHAKIEKIYDEWLLENEAMKIKFENELKPRDSKGIFGRSIKELEADKYMQNILARYEKELAELNVYQRGNGIVHYALRRIIYSLRKSNMPQDDILEFVGNNITGGQTSEIEALVYSNISE